MGRERELVDDQDAKRSYDTEPALLRIGSEEAAVRGGRDRVVRDPRVTSEYPSGPGR